MIEIEAETLERINKQLEQAPESLYSLTIFAWGIEPQEEVMMEEMTELHKALLKYRRFRRKLIREKVEDKTPLFTAQVIGELADVKLLLNQMISYYTGGVNSEEFKQAYEKSKNKLKDKLKKIPRVQDLLKDIDSRGPEVYSHQLGGL